MAVAADGARQVIGFFDWQRQASCITTNDPWDFQYTSTAGTWPYDLCLPAGFAWANAFADAACSRVAAHAPPSCAPPPLAIDILPTSDACVGKFVGYGVGAPIPSVLQETAGVCGPATDDLVVGDRDYATTGPLDISSFPRVEFAPVGTAPLQVWYRTSHGVPLMPYDSFQSGGKSCDPIQLVDGTWRCISGPIGPAPDASLDPLFFADPACTHAVVRAEGDPCGTIAMLVHYVPRGPLCGEAPPDAFYETGAPAPLATVYQLVAGQGCLPMASSPPTVWFPVGPQIDPTTFPLLIERTQ